MAGMPAATLAAKLATRGAGNPLALPNTEQPRRPVSIPRRLEKGRCNFWGIECAKLSYSYTRRRRLV